MLIGSHVEGSDPFIGATNRDAGVVQVNLSAPRNWRAPKVRPDTERLLAWDVPVFVHAPYLLNPASINPEVREKSRKCLQEQLEACERIGARGLVVHGGHPTGSGSLSDGIRGWVEVLMGVDSPVPVLIENTAGGKAAVGRRLGDFAQLWKALPDTGANVGYCLDTCHAHAGGESLDGIVERTLEVTGQIDLVHVNDSKDAFDSSRDRHENVGAGQIGVEMLAGVVRSAHLLASAPAVVETPGEGFQKQAADIVLLREHLAAL